MHSPVARYTLGTRTPYRYTSAPTPTVANAVSDARGCQITPYTIMQVPTRIYEAGISGHANSSAFSRCHPARRRRYTKTEATESTVNRVRLNPIYNTNCGNGVTVIAMAQSPWLRMALTGVCQRASTLAAPLKNALFRAMAWYTRGPMVTIAFTVETMEMAISAENTPATRGPKRLDAESVPTAMTPFRFSSGVA